jgi:hypothetical protein
MSVELVTEKEASVLWCPFARSYDASPTLPDDMIASGTNRQTGGAGDKWCRCIASNCMAWRWDPHPDPFSRTEARGFCGLVGAP